MTTQTKEPSSTRLDELSRELDDLEAKRSQAERELEGMEARIQQLEAEQIPLTPLAFSGDKSSASKLASLETKVEKAIRRRKFLRNATAEFERMIAETKAQRAEERKGLARERYDEIAREREALWNEAEQQVKALRETLVSLSNTDTPLAQEARVAFGQEAANSIAQSPVQGRARVWLHKRLRPWL